MYTKAIRRGVYTDRAGEKTSWEITEAHTLQWGNAPYLPVGSAFTPRSFASDADSAWEEDRRVLTARKNKGLLDLLLTPEKSLLDVPPAALQRLLDYLDANDFRYGLSFGTGLTTPLTGTVVKPAAYRVADTQDTLSATWQVPNTDIGLYLVTNASDDNRILNWGIAPARDNLISIPVESASNAGRIVALLYPHKSLPVTGEGALPDLWSGFDDYRDRALAFFSKVKLGKGFRFFVDPLTRRIGLTGDTDYLIPSSPGFLLEWEGFLTRKYPNIEEVKIAWGLNDLDLKTHRDLARLIPLWANVNGVPYYYDFAPQKYYRITDARQSRWWQDFLQCRTESILYYMNAMADLLKRQVAEVPVVYTWTQPHPIFWNTSREGGYDGLAVTARGASLVARVLGPAYSEVEQAESGLWCLAADFAVTDSRAALFHDLDLAQRVGFKGVFADEAPPALGQPESGDVTRVDGADWLREFATQWERAEGAAKYTPNVLFYPQAAPGPAHIGFIGKANTLWLNSFYSGEVLDWWPAYSGYTIQKGDGDEARETVLLSLLGKRETRLWVLSRAPGVDARAIKATTPEGTEVPTKVTGKMTLTVTLDETPTIFRAVGPKGEILPHPQQLVPQEASEDILIQLRALLETATAQKLTSVDNVRPSLDRGAYAYKQKDFATAYLFARSALDELTYFAAPYIWIEGESAKVHTFGEVAANYEASSGGFLRLSTPSPPNRLGYAARYYFDVAVEGKYDVWLAGTSPGSGTSPIKWRLNSEPVRDPMGTGTVGPLYLGERFGWTPLGSVTLQKGPQQILSIYVADRASSPQEYLFSIDALLLIPQARAFSPNGTVRPVPVDVKTLSPKERKRLFP